MDGQRAQDVVPVWLGGEAQGFLPPRLESAWLHGLEELGSGWRRVTGSQGLDWVARVAVGGAGSLAVGVEGVPAAEVVHRVDEVFAGFGLGAWSRGGGSLESAELSVWACGARRVGLAAGRSVVRALWAGAHGVPAGWPEVLGRIALPVVVEVGRRGLALDALMRLAVGQVLLFGPREEGFALRVGGVQVQRVVPVRREGRLGCRVVDGGR